MQSANLSNLLILSGTQNIKIATLNGFVQSLVFCDIVLMRCGGRF